MKNVRWAILGALVLAMAWSAGAQERPRVPMAAIAVGVDVDTGLTGGRRVFHVGEDIPFVAELSNPAPSGNDCRLEVQNVSETWSDGTTTDPFVGEQTPPNTLPYVLQIVGDPDNSREYTYVRTVTPASVFTDIDGTRRVRSTVAADGVMLDTCTGDDAQGSANVSPLILEPCVEVTKTAEPTVTKAGHEVLYTICVTNCGNADLTVVSVMDDLLGDITSLFNSTLPADGPEECVTYTYLVPDGAPDPLENTVTVTYVDEIGGAEGTVTASASASVDLIHPSIEVTAECMTPEVMPGGNADIQFTFDNTGDVSLFFDIADNTYIPDFTLDAGATRTETATVPDPGGVEEICYTVDVVATLPQYEHLDNEYTATATACCPITPPVELGRWTGGGTIDSVATIPEGATVTHGFEFHCDLRKPNNLQVNWSGGNRFHMTELIAITTCYMNPSLPLPDPPEAPINEVEGIGVGRYNNQRDYIIAFHLTDVGEPGLNDYASIVITAPGGEVVLQVEGTLHYGNQQAHRDRKAEGGDSGGASGGDSGLDSPTPIPKSLMFRPPVPNPFSHTVKLSYGLPVSGRVRVEIYDVAGRRLATLVDEEQPAGFHAVTWDAADQHGNKVAPGIYFSRVQFSGQTAVTKMIVLQ